jgi:arabinofuranan 3-O-arabinosyltransferase
MHVSSTLTSEIEPTHEPVSEPVLEPPVRGGASEGRASRWWLAGAFVLALAAFVPDAFGRQVFDTKIDLAVSPVAFLHNILYLWDPNGWFGYLRNQIQGYAFPTAPFFVVGHALGLPAWLVERLWMATVVTVAFWGIVRLAEVLRIGSLGPRLAAGAAFALLPALTILVGSVTAEAAPGVLTAWALIPLVRASRGGSPLRGAALSGVAVLFMGGANAADTLYALIIPAIFLLTRASSPRKWSLAGWWVVCVGLATAWWAIPLAFLGKYGFNFLPYIEQSVTTTSTSSATTALSGSGVWTAYLNLNGLDWNQAALTVTRLAIPILGAGLVAAAGLYGIASRDIRERRFLVVSLAVLVVGALAAYWGTFGGPGSHLLLPILNGPLSPLRSVYKIEPAIGLVLALGIAHSLYKLSNWRPAYLARSTWRIAAVAVTIVVLASLATPYLLGRATNNYSYTSIPSYWNKVAAYLDHSSPRNTALVLPAEGHGEYVWGWSIDQPLEALANSPWADDQDVPFGGAGSSRMVDAIETALRTDTPIPELTALLWRSGVKDVVVQNDLQWELSDSPSPLQVHHVLEASGLKRVAQFGPTIETPVIDIPTLSLINTRAKSAYPAVEIYQAPPPPGEKKGPASPVATLAASSAALVSGGPEAIGQLLDQGLLGVNQAAILAGDWNGKYHGPIFAVTDTLRRQDINSGLVNDNSSYTLTATAQVPVQEGLPENSSPPSQLLPFEGVQHQTVAVIKGAKSITASSTGSAFYYLPEYNPANLFDGESATGWISSNPYGSVGQWVQINFDHPVNPKGTRVQFLVGAAHPRVTGVRVSTNRGSVLTQVSPSASGSQLLNVPAGRASYLRITFVSFRASGHGNVGAGIQKVSVPGVHVQELLKPPEESIGKTAQRVAYSFQTAPYDPYDVLRSAPEPVMARAFSTPRKMTVTVVGKATPFPSVALNKLIGPSPSGLSISASSTFGNIPSFRPQDLIDNDPDTAWIAATPTASIHLHWSQPVSLSSVELVPARNDFAARPTEVRISSSAGHRLIHVGQSTTLNFAPLKTNSVTVSFLKVKKVTIPNGFGGQVQAPVGLADIKFPALSLLYGTAPNLATPVTVPCGSGPPVVIDGKQYETTVEQLGHGPTPTINDLVNLKPLSMTICSPFGTTNFTSGSHVLVAPITGSSAFNVTSLTLNQTNPTAPAPSVAHHAPVRSAHVVSWGQESRKLAISSGSATYLEVHQNFNAGWTASLNGKALTPIRLDGWQQGYLVPAGRGGTVQLTFGPERTYLVGLGLGAIGVLLLLLLAVGLIGRHRWEDLEPSPPWNKQVPFWLAIGLAAAVIFVIGGPVVLAVPVLAYVGSRRPVWLPWVAFVGMAIAAVVAAVHPGTGALSGVGAFSGTAQVCALIALSAVLVPVAYRRSRAGKEPNSDAADDAAQPDADAESTADAESVLAGGTG